MPDYNSYLDTDYGQVIENADAGQVGGGLLGIAGTMYGWSILGMIDQFPTIKRNAAGKVVGGGMGVLRLPLTKLSVDLVRRRGNPYGIIKERAPIGIREGIDLARNRKLASDNLSRFIFGNSYRGANKLGWAALGVARAVGVGFSVMTWTDPLMFAFQYWRNIPMMAVGAAYFGSIGAWQKTRRDMERTQYARMSVGFPDSQGAFTSRQRAVRAISESQLQARSAIGMEAQLFHR